MPILLLLLFITHAYQETPRVELITHGATATFQDGILALQGSGGWVGSRQMFVDFEMTLDFRAHSEETDAGIIVRGFDSPVRIPSTGFRISLPTREVPPSSLIAGEKLNVDSVKKGALRLRPRDRWQALRIAATGRWISVFVNGEFAAAFEAAAHTGFIMFDCLTGGVQLRDINIQPRDVPFPDGIMGEKALKKAGGTMPTVVREVRPEYTSEAMRNRIEGVVVVHAVVLPDGTVGATKVTRPLPFGLTANAVKAVVGWTFTPARLNGEAVPLVVEIKLTFKLK